MWMEVKYLYRTDGSSKNVFSRLYIQRIFLYGQTTLEKYVMQIGVICFIFLSTISFATAQADTANRRIEAKIETLRQEFSSYKQDSVLLITRETYNMALNSTISTNEFLKWVLGISVTILTLSVTIVSGLSIWYDKKNRDSISALSVKFDSAKNEFEVKEQEFDQKKKEFTDAISIFSTEHKTIKSDFEKLEEEVNQKRKALADYLYQCDSKIKELVEATFKASEMQNQMERQTEKNFQKYAAISNKPDETNNPERG